MTDFTPTLTPFADHDAELAKAEAGVAKLAATRNDRWYPKFHIASDGGWINDPNGLCYYKGRWHVFYQLFPYGTAWGLCHWGHVSSADLVTWRREPITMAPSLEQERDGVFSGSAAIGDDGELRFYYTGHRWANGRDNTGGEWQVQMMAVPDDDELRHVTKLGMIIDCPRDKVHWHFRDPKVWKTGDVWYMVHGVSSADRRGQMWLYTSEDMVEWTFKTVLFEHPDPDVFMLECPDFFPLADRDGNEKWVLCFSAMGSRPKGFMNRNANNAGYMIGTWEPGGAFEPQTEFRLWDCGHNYYAPQSFDAPDGRRIMVGWMSPFDHAMAMAGDGWCGQLTQLREVFLGEDGDVHTVPVPEADALRADDVEFGAVDLAEGGRMTLDADLEAGEIELSIDLANTTAERCGLRVHETQDGGYVYVAYDAQTGCVVLDRQNGSGTDGGYRAAPLSDDELAADALKLRVFVDRGSVEVYVNDGHQVLSSYNFPTQGPRAVSLTCESGGLRVKGLTLHHLNGIALE
ncbi:glycoside hydrolase family 32 protein [Bifidobacterium phasiani]|uniref:beta-fructofuranosidase n=1 Tax=Bifidobacterium phasiani TaxID=2834431 RepID=A0ABS6WCD9_9BIFI|nr:GH32 C-terminal domain-containing protein [Bifidobacterium phasiani]MBW3083729.1 GH32 C-terminal domain-containing protein [Bifidobacterium phasiani]